MKVISFTNAKFTLSILKCKMKFTKLNDHLQHEPKGGYKYFKLYFFLALVRNARFAIRQNNEAVPYKSPKKWQKSYKSLWCCHYIIRFI